MPPGMRKSVASYFAVIQLFPLFMAETCPTKAPIAYATEETLILQTFPSNNDGDR